MPQSAKNFKSLSLALAYLRRHPGRFIFPIKAGAKFPPLLKENLDANASNDPKRIARWAKKFPGCNWGVAHRKSGLMVVDVDCNQAKGKVGRDTYDALALAYDWPDTETTTTPSGGFHLVYEGWADERHAAHIMALGVNGLGRDIDSPNYTLIPGCVFADGTSYVGNGAPAVRCPEWIYDVILTAKQRNKSMSGVDASEVVVDLDKKSNIDTAIDFLQNDAPPAVQGQNGDEKTLRTAMYLKDLGISVDVGAQLLNDYYNPRCNPPWDIDDLRRKMENAYAYGTGSKVGGKTAEADFADDAAPDVKPMGDPKKIERQQDANMKAKLAFKDQWAYLAFQERFVKLSNRQRMWKITAFDNRFASLPVTGKSPKEALSKHIFRNNLLPIFETAVFEPGNVADNIVGGNFNMWMPSDLEPSAGNTSKIDAHMAYLFPDQAIRDHVLNWLAWVYCNQERKPRHALLIHGERTGTGKSFIAHMMARLLGKKMPNGLYSNTTTIKGSTLDAAHGGWEYNTKLLVVEEVRPGFGSSQAVVKGLHELISEPTIWVDLKNMQPEPIPNYIAPLLFSNKLNALAIDNTERRYLIVSVDPVPGSSILIPKPDSYYIDLYALLDDPVTMAAIAYQLKTRDLKGYSGLGAAPATKAKAKMAEETRDDLERWFDENVSNAPLRYSVVKLEEVEDAVPTDLRQRGWRGRIVSMVRAKLKGVKIGEVRFGGRDAPKYRLWGLRGVTRKMSDKALAKLYRTEHDQLTLTEKADNAARDAAELAEALTEFEVDVVALTREAAPAVDPLADLM